MDTNSNIPTEKRISSVNNLMRSLRLLCWLGAASVPFLINRFYNLYRNAIQCPVSGDCYTPGSEHLFGIEGTDRVFSSCNLASISLVRCD